MNFSELINKVNKLDKKNIKEISKIVENINIGKDNFDEWVNNIFSEKINSFDMGKLPYLIDELYKTNDQLKFKLCCMLLEASCDKLEFITNLENHPVFKAKFEIFTHTLVTVYDHVDNGIANCMALIVINNDPQYTLFDEEAKQIIIHATRRKLKAILEYLKDGQINPAVFGDLEVIVDMACYLNDSEISKLIDAIDKLGNNEYADIFIIKYKIINNIEPIESKINSIIHSNSKDLCILYEVMEKLGVQNKYMKNITQEMVAKSDMIRWLEYPTELDSVPDKIELIGEFKRNNQKFYAFKFSKDDFKIKVDLIGVSGGYPLDSITAMPSGFTFSEFETLVDNWEEQANRIVDKIEKYWKKRNESIKD